MKALILWNTLTVALKTVAKTREMLRPSNGEAGQENFA